MTEQTTTDRPWMTARPGTFWMVNGDRIFNCIAHVLDPQPGDHGNPRFQLVMHDGSTHDDIYYGDELTDATPLAVIAQSRLDDLTKPRKVRHVPRPNDHRWDCERCGHPQAEHHDIRSECHHMTLDGANITDRCGCPTFTPRKDHP